MLGPTKEEKNILLTYLSKYMYTGILYAYFSLLNLFETNTIDCTLSIKLNSQFVLHNA